MKYIILTLSLLFSFSLSGQHMMLVGGEEPGPFPGLLLDIHPAYAAYSLRRLSSSYTGDVIRVRRDSDNTEQDFSDIEITNGTLLSWVGSGNGYITIWYDQSGNSLHATQSTQSYQRVIVVSGTLQTINLLPCDNYISGSRSYEVPNAPYSAPFTYFMVAKPDANGSDVYQANGNNGTSILDNNKTRFYGGNFVDVNHNGGLLYQVSCALFNGASSEFQVNSFSTTGNIGSSTNVASNSFAFAGYYRNSSQVFTGRFQEMIIYTSDQSANKSQIINNINNYYTIY